MKHLSVESLICFYPFEAVTKKKLTAMVLHHFLIWIELQNWPTQVWWEVPICGNCFTWIGYSIISINGDFGHQKLL